MRPVICMITDGRLGSSRSAESVIGMVAAAARAGVDLIQIRERAVDDRVLAAVVGRAVAAVRGLRTRVIVNDRLDVALAAGAHGVHLRADSCPARRVRQVTGAGFLIGRSIHSAVDAIRAAESGSVDYLIFGTLFPSASKPGRAPAGVAALADTVRATSIPVLGIGGVTAENAALVARTGAAGLAAIGLFSDGTLQSITAIVERIEQAFDTPERGS
jgi:thiamine-phosphate pyrophosphorylase